MGKKRQFSSTESKNVKSVSVEVITEDVTSHPLCFHGPTLLFSSEKGRYFSCSLCRNKKDCTVHISEEDWEKEAVKKRNEKYQSLIRNVDKKGQWKYFKEIKSEHPSKRAYCVTCSELYVISNSNKKHLKDHRIVTPLTDEQLSEPSGWLPPLENDTTEAQYLFNKKTIGFIFSILKKNNINNILCIGTPSIHDSAGSRPEFTSLLLDYDHRYAQFNSPDKYIYYNMFNNHLFNGREDELVLKKFMKKAGKDLCIVMDPPFGGRVEPLVQTLRDLSEAHHAACVPGAPGAAGLLPVIWAFPYFSEPYITNMAPEIKMHDYQVEYTNHRKFQSGTPLGRKHGSPVRLFTSLPLASLDLSHDAKYRLCKKCGHWVSVTNKHCNKCQCCTSKNGMTYTHCDACGRCVKPTFFHCDACARCCQRRDHVCGAVVKSQSCYGCNEKGHKKVDCPKNETEAKKKRKHA